MSAAEKLDLLLHRFVSGFLSIPARQPATGPITFAQMRVLWTLDLNGATGLIERLAYVGYIGRAHSTRDRRQVLLRLRPKGRRVMAGFRRLRLSRLNTLMSRLARGDVRRMTEALRTLNDILVRGKDAR